MYYNGCDTECIRKDVVIIERTVLRAQREKRDKTQAQLAQSIGISEVYVRKLESGASRPGYGVVKKFVDYYQQPANKLFPDIFLPLIDTKRSKEEAAK